VVLESAGGDVTLSNNTITGNGNSGIYCGNSSPVISGNTVSGSGYGLYVTGAALPSSVTGNTLDGNSSGPVGLAADSSGTVIAESNTFSGPIRVEGGTITRDTTWVSNRVYHVLGNIGIHAGVTLTVPAGRVVKVASNIYIGVSGHLAAVGSSTNRIYFTDYRDDTVGGDTNGDGSATTPAGGWWFGIHVNDGGSMALDYAEVRYGWSGYIGGWPYYYYDYFGPVYKTGGGNISITNSVIRDSSGYGVWIRESSGTHTLTANTIQNNGSHGVVLESAGGDVTLSNNTITGNGNSGIYVAGASTTPGVFKNRIHSNRIGVYCTTSANPLVGGSITKGNDIYNNSDYGVENITSSILVNARFNYWGSPSGPFHPTTNAAGTGNRVSDYVDYGNYFGVSALEEAPNISVSPPSKDFGSVAIGTPSPPQTFTFTNNGTVDLTISKIDLEGDTAEFSVQNDRCSNQSLQPFSTCTMDVVFWPTSKATKTANVKVPSNDPDMAELTIPLRGAGVPLDLGRTGQKKTYAEGDDGYIRAGILWPSPRFVVNDDTTVTDNLTGLVWAPDAGTPSVGPCEGGTKSWQEALDYVACLNANNYLGYGDWRLPNVNELESLNHADLTNSASWLMSQGFNNVASCATCFYWSSTTWAHPDYPGYAWVVFVDEGHIHADDKIGGYDGYTWPVREMSSGLTPLWQTGQTVTYDANTPQADDGALRQGVSWPDPRFSTNPDATVTDNLTGLIWAPDAGTPTVGTCTGGAKDWTAALAYVACLNTSAYLGHDDWRLPNRRELYSLIDHSRFDPALPAGHPFTGVQTDPYWSSTTSSFNTANAFNVRISDGYVFAGNTYPKTSPLFVWPVRGGVVLNPDILVTPSALDFGNVLIGSTLTKEIEVKNSGAISLLIDSVSAPATPFSITDGCSGKSLAPNETCIIQVHFEAAQGEFTSSLDIVSDDPNESLVTVDLTGRGVFFTVSPEEGTIGTILELSGPGFGTKKGKVALHAGTISYALKVLEWNLGGSNVVKAQLTKPIPGGALCDVILYPKEPKGASPILEPGAFGVKKPLILELSSMEGGIGQTIKIRGKFLGTKKGKVYLENPMTKVRKSCKVLSWPTTPEGGTGEGEVAFTVPKVISAIYNVVLQNPVGEDLVEGFFVSP